MIAMCDLNVMASGWCGQSSSTGFNLKATTGIVASFHQSNPPSRVIPNKVLHTTLMDRINAFVRRD